MSRLQEHDAKRLLAGYGVPSPPGRHCATEADVAAALEVLALPVYLKAQIPIGDRKTVDAIRRAASADEALVAARELLSGTFGGHRPDGVLCEEEVVASRELYLSVAISERHRARRLSVGLAGGRGFDAATADGELVIDPLVGDAPPYAIRRMLAGLGFAGAPLMKLAAIAHGAVRCAEEAQAYTVEINPLLETESGFVAVDAKVELDDYAARLRPAELTSLAVTGSAREQEAAEVQRDDHRGSFRYVQMVDEGEIEPTMIGTHSVGGGESLVVLDALGSVDLVATNYCDTSGSPSAEKVAAAARLIATQPGIAGYFFSSCIANQPLSITANGLVAGFDEAGWTGPTVVRIAGNQEDEAQEIVAAWARRTGAPTRVYGREIDEWQAAAAMASLLANGNGGGS